jgi:hypothetical protein
VPFSLAPGNRTTVNVELRFIYGPAITHKDEHFAKTPLNFNENFKSSNLNPLLNPFFGQKQHVIHLSAEFN